MNETANQVDAAEWATDPEFLRSMIDPADADQSLMAAQCVVLMEAYHDRWQHDEWAVEGIELPQHLPVVNPATGCRSRTFTHAGKLDGLVVDPMGRRYVLEHKTTSDSLAGEADGPYWQRLTIDSQVSKYLLQCWQEGVERLEGCLYDVVRKPRTSPKKITKADAKRINDGREYCGREVPIEDVREWFDAGGDRETLPLYMIRLRSEIDADPSAWFQRRIVSRTSDEVLDYARELWALASDVKEERRRELWPKNTAACWDYQRPCTYLGLCSGFDHPESDKWRRAEFVHAELAEDGIRDASFTRGERGLSILTNSRLKCFQTCRRKHFYQYELGLKRADERTADALMFGLLWHAMQERWWAARYSLSPATKG